MRVTGFRIVLGLTAMATMLTLTACGGDEPTTAPTSTNVPATAPPATTAPAATTPSLAPRPTATQPPAPTAPPTAAFDAEAYFKGRTVRVVVGFSPGGGTDTQARFLSGVLPRFIPGKPRFVVSNLTPNVAATNFAWKSKPDGLTLQYNASSGIQGQTDPNANYKSSEFTHIAAAVTRDALWMIRGTLPYNCINDAVGATDPPIIMAGSAPSPGELTGVGDLGPFILADFLNLPFEFKQVAATGTDQDLLLIERGDINSFAAGSVWYQLPTRRPGWVREGYIRPFAQMASATSKVLANSEGEVNCPNGRDLLTDQQKAIWDGLMSPEIFVGKNLWGPPGMPEEITSVYKNAWNSMVNDDTLRSKFESLLGQPLAEFPADLRKMWKDVEDAFLANQDQLDAVQERVHSRFIK